MRHDILSPRYEGPYKKAPKAKAKARKVVAYRVMYGGSVQHDSRGSRRLYTKDAARRIAKRLERRGIPAYVGSLTVSSHDKLRGIRKSKTRRSR